MVLTFVLLVVGLALVIFGGDLFVRAAVGIAERFRLPHVVVGGTLMSLATTSPEIVVSVVSGIRGAPGLAVGNAIGSALCNMALIGGTMALMTRVVIRHQEVVRPYFLFAGLAILLLVLSLDGRVSQIEAGLLLLAGVTYFVVSLLRNLRSTPNPELEAEAAVLEEAHKPLRSGWASGLLFLFAAAMVVGGSHLLVDNAVEIAKWLEVPEIIIGLTVVSVGTSLPEYVTAISSARRKVSDLAVGNILGANIANLTLVAGSAGLFTPITLRNQDLWLNFPALLGITAVLGYFLFRRGVMARGAGLLLLGLYATYLVLLIASEHER